MKRAVPAWLMLAPFLIFFAVFLFGPLLYAMYISLYGERFGTQFFVGLTNYIDAFQDPNFWPAVGRVLFFGVVEVTCMIVLALAFALLLDGPLARFKTLFRLVYFLPYAVPAVVATIMWGFLYSTTMDSQFLNFLGGGAAHPFNPTGTGTLLYAIVNIVLWEFVGYNMTLYYAALTGIPLDLYDGAKIDGANEWRMAWNIKLPMIRPMVIMTVVLSIVGALQLFNEPFFLSQLVPISLDYTPNSEIYYSAFTFENIPYAATLSMILGFICIALAVTFMLIVRRAGRRQIGFREEGIPEDRAGRDTVAMGGM